MKKILALLIVLILAATFVQAEMVVNKFTNDFSVSSPYADEVKICSCESRGDTFTVENTGNFRATYHVDVLSEQPEWYDVQLQDFSLSPGESRDVLLYANAPCGVVGQYSYSVRFASSFGRERIITRDFDIKKCQNAFLTITDGHNNSNVGQPIHYTLHVKNVAEFADTFTIDLGAFDENAQFENGESSFYLVPNEEKTLNVTITPPPSVYGDIDFVFTISSEKNKVTEQKSTHIFIENLFDHDVVVETQAEYCSRVTNELTFTVKNLIEIPNDYDVIITGPGYMDYAPKELHLEGYEEKNVTITLSPKKGQEGTEFIRIRVNSKLGEIKKEREIELNVFDCYAFDLGFVDQERDETGAFVEKECCGTHEYELNIRNSGQTEETYNIDVDGPDWFSAEEKTIRLKPSENRNVKFTAQLPCTDETYELPVTVQLTNRPEITETVLFKVESLTQRSCYAVEARPDLVNMDEEDTLVPFIISHVGLEPGVYDVTVDGELFTGALEKRITLEPGEEAVLHAETKGNLTDYFDGRYLGALELTQTDLNISYREGFWTKFNHISWFTQAFRKIVRYDYANVAACLWIMLILFILAIVTIILFTRLLMRKVERKPYTMTGLVILRTILILLAAIALLALLLTPLPAKASLYVAQEHQDDGIVFEWFENEPYKVVLSDYFDDPDADWLEYIATQPPHIAVEIDGSKARLLPERNWAGEEQIVFTASDQRGGIVDSPIITLRVLQRKELTMGQWLLRYCTHLNLLLLFIILLLLVILSFVTLKARERIPYGEVLPPRKPKGGSVYTVVSTRGEVKKLGEVPVAPVAPVKKSVKKPVKKATKKKVVAPAKKRVRRMTAAQKAALSKALDRALVSSEDHEMKQVLRTHGKRETKENVKILRRALKNFKRNKQYKPQNRVSFYRYLKEKNILRRLSNAVVTKPIKKLSVQSKTSKALDRALVSSQTHEMHQVLRTHGKKASASNVKILREALKKFKASPGFKPKNRVSFYRYLKEKNILRKLLNAKKVTVAATVVKKSAKSSRVAKRASRAVTRRASPKSVKAVPFPSNRVEVPQEFIETSSPQTQVNIAVGTSVPEPKEIILVGAKNGTKVHDPQCIVAQRIAKDARVSFNSKAAASKAGYGPCKVCQSFDKA